MHTYSRSLGWTAVAATIALVAVGCTSSATSGDESDTQPPSVAEGTVTYPLTIDNCGYKQTFTKPPQRVLLMQGASVGEAETLIHLGLDDSVIANTQYYGVSDTPGMAEKVDALPRGGDRAQRGVRCASGTGFGAEARPRHLHIFRRVRQ